MPFCFKVTFGKKEPYRSRLTDTSPVETFGSKSVSIKDNQLCFESELIEGLGVESTG